MRSTPGTSSLSVVRDRQNRFREAGLIGLIVAALALAGCGSGDANATTTTEGATSTTMAYVTTTTAGNTTTTIATTTSTPAAPTTTRVADTNSLAEGSGCTPGAGDLPDGLWFGYVDDASAGEIDFDLACWFTGDAAALAAAEDGEESPPPNDYYVRNVNPTVRTITVSGATVAWFSNPGDPSTETTVPYADWVGNRGNRDYQPGVWLTIEDGVVAFIQEQYVP